MGVTHGDIILLAQRTALSGALREGFCRRLFTHGQDAHATPNENARPMGRTGVAFDSDERF